MSVDAGPPRSLSVKAKSALEPFAWIWAGMGGRGTVDPDPAELSRVMRLVLSMLSEEARRDALSAAATVSETNCWFATFQGARALLASLETSPTEVSP